MVTSWPTRGPKAESAPQGAGVLVGPYRLLAKIGEGGMGVVHLAQAPDGRRVALKVLRPSVIGDDEARARLAQEVAALRRVTSPRIAEVIDADPWGETPYVATRYVPGLSLHHHVREEGAVTGTDLRYLARGLLEAIVAVHRVGVLHRDVKPSNVVLEGRAPVLIDFGLARLAEDPRLTHTGWLMGTPGYLAPEILYGEDATPASDVHAWAATVAFAALGRPPYGNGPAMAVMDRVRRGEHDLAGTPPWLRPLLEACLDTEARRRPAPGRVLAALGDLSAGDTRPVAAWLPPGGDGATTTIVTEARTGPRTRPTGVSLAATGSYTTPAPVPQLAAGSPYVPAALQTWRPPPGGVPRLQRGLVLGGLLALVTVGAALAPYLALLVLVLAVHLVRTWSWTTESASLRVQARGDRRWYDPVLTTVSAPWYVVVAVGGTAVLALWVAGVALVVGLAYVVFRLPVLPGLLVVGAAAALATWWGPGARRIRLPVRRAVAGVTGGRGSGWVAAGALAVAIGVLALLVSQNGVDWSPAAGAPWRPGTILGDLATWL